MRSLRIAFWICASLLVGASSAAAHARHKVLFSFCTEDSFCSGGMYPYAGVTSVGDDLYTTTMTGGDGNNGTLIAVDRKTGAGRVVIQFGDGVGSFAQAGLIRVKRKLYGTTANGGTGNGGNGGGVLYEVVPNRGRVSTLYSFCSQANCTDGAGPGELTKMGSLLYGTSSLGGSAASCNPGCGTVFSFDPASGAERVVYSFCGATPCDSGNPTGGLAAVHGILYGTTAQGGDGVGCDDTGRGCGTVYALDPLSGQETVLHTFAGNADGGLPMGRLLAYGGKLYGTTYYGGTRVECGNGCGSVFSLDPETGAFAVLHLFKPNGKDGLNPRSGLAALSGMLYGTTQGGGAHDGGTVFSLDPSTARTRIVYDFCSETRCNDGAAPYAGLTVADGKLYGTTEAGGTGDADFAIGAGTVFQLTP